MKGGDAPTGLPQYRPGIEQLPPALRELDPATFAFHFSEPERVGRIVGSDTHPATAVGAGDHRVYLTRLGPHVADAATILERLFVGNRARIPSLWGVLVYRVQPNALGLAVLPDLTLPADAQAFYTPAFRSGLRPVSDYLLACGYANPAGSGLRWAWVEP